MKGSEKQVKWATDIKQEIERTIKEVEEIKRFIVKPRAMEKFELGFNVLTKYINSIDEAAVYIDGFKTILDGKGNPHYEKNLYHRYMDIYRGLSAKKFAITQDEKEKLLKLCDYVEWAYNRPEAGIFDKENPEWKAFNEKHFRG